MHTGAIFRRFADHMDVTSLGCVLQDGKCFTRDTRLAPGGLLPRCAPPCRKGTGFVQPLGPRDHWHGRFFALSIRPHFLFTSAASTTASRCIAHWESRTPLKESEVELFLQRSFLPGTNRIRGGSPAKSRWLSLHSSFIDAPDCQSFRKDFACACSLRAGLTPHAQK